MTESPVDLLVNHIGYLCQAQKKVVIPQGPYTRFEVQDMGHPTAEALGAYENWATVFEGPLEIQETDVGHYLIGDFSALTHPGVYRVVLPEDQGWSYQFIITDGAFHPMLRLFLDHIHDRRSGNFENEWRGPSHLDDAVRTDTGEAIDVSGGWYDAGDLRKWMSTMVLPALGFLDIQKSLAPRWNHFAEEEVTNRDLITETVWCARFILSMQDPNTGMIFEEIGGGGQGRYQPGMSWWYENHSGCYADNSQNYFSDNQIGSGDERVIRTTYNPIVQYTNLTILLRTAEAVEPHDSPLAERFRAGARRAWDFVQSKAADDEMHLWTAVRSWRLIAGLEAEKAGWISSAALVPMATDLLSNGLAEMGWWAMDSSLSDPYRGILHSAHPVIALCLWHQGFPDDAKAAGAIEKLQAVWETYVQPMRSTNPFGMMPYGRYFAPATELDHFRPYGADQFYRFYMPEHSKQRVNHGLSGHWTSWAHGLALMGDVLDAPEITAAAWDQLYWLWGSNFHNSCLVSGVGFRHPMPHSRFHGTMPGGFCVGFRGSPEDDPILDLGAHAEWNSTEYWNTPIANGMMALSVLLPKEIPASRKLGYPKSS